jgi:lysophospholipase L1-like esterase
MGAGSSCFVEFVSLFRLDGSVHEDVNFRRNSLISTAMQIIQRRFLAIIKSVILCGAVAAGPWLRAADGASPKAAWDWTGILGTGQSLSVGEKGQPVLSTTQPYHNLKLSTDDLHWPVDPDAPELKMVPLIEPVGRMAPRYPSSWPENIAGETPHSAMANELTALVMAASGGDFVTVHSCVGENGQGMKFLKKNAMVVGTNGHSYEGALIETKAIARLAKAAGKTYGIGAITIIHGESDAGNADYEKQLHQLWSDYNTDLPAITGQSQKILMIVSQQNSINDRSPSTQAQWRAGVDYPDDIVCAGPKYQYAYAEGIHLTAPGYQALGEKFAEIYYQRVLLGNHWEPLAPTGIERNGAVITVHFHVPVGPLVWDATMQTPHGTNEEWKAGKGFEVATAAKTPKAKVGITSVEISGDSVVITCATDPGAGARVSYAMIGEKPRMASPFKGTFRWGLLRDSDPFEGSVTKTVQPNYCVAFEMTAE